jgi:hypothetical protein
MKVSIAIVLSALILAGCATEQPAAPVSNNNPLENQCRAEGVGPGAAMTACVRHKAALGVGRNSCQKRGLKSGPAMDNCVRLEAQFTEATLQCQDEGKSSNEIDAFKACIAAKAPEAAAYAMPKTN